ncbi:MAG TPA: hypothetical protein VG994_13150 [Steroidobacteraceae bacterium]|nr:hypothetical protein [Steroidobacteraceae bacterium]
MHESRRRARKSGRYADWDEIRALTLDGYRHFAKKSMLAALEPTVRSASKRTP